MKKLSSYLYPLICLFAVLLTAGNAHGFELHTNYATIVYNSYDDLVRFNNEIYLGKYSYLVKNDNITTIEDEVIYKIDFIVDKTKSILNMFPDEIKFKIAVCESTKELKNNYKTIYGKTTDFIAFYSPKINTVYFSITNLEFQTVVHEFAHMIVEHYFQVSPPVKIHEILADYAEKTVLED